MFKRILCAWTFCTMRHVSHTLKFNERYLEDLGTPRNRRLKVESVVRTLRLERGRRQVDISDSFGMETFAVRDAVDASNYTLVGGIYLFAHGFASGKGTGVLSVKRIVDFFDPSMNREYGVVQGLKDLKEEEGASSLDLTEARRHQPRWDLVLSLYAAYSNDEEVF